MFYCRHLIVSSCGMTGYDWHVIEQCLDISQLIWRGLRFFWVKTWLWCNIYVYGQIMRRGETIFLLLNHEKVIEP